MEEKPAFTTLEWNMGHEASISLSASLPQSKALNPLSVFFQDTNSAECVYCITVRHTWGETELCLPPASSPPEQLL